MDLELLEDITFKTLSYRKNFDMIQDNENIITELEGSVTKLRIDEKIPPEIIGEYELSIWDIRTAKILNYDTYEILQSVSGLDTYDELIKLINNKQFNINKYNRIVFIHTFLLKDEYRKKELTEEFIEYLFRDFYDDNTAIICLVKPFQNNKMDFDYFYHERYIVNKVDHDSANDQLIPMKTYYKLDKLLQKTDTELNEYKLFSVAAKCGFVRLDDQHHLFILNPKKTIDRLKLKSMKSIKK
ncbi:MAG: hypothetical protein ACOC2W_02580 [bacterium]